MKDGVFFIAEIGLNHNGDIGLAKDMVAAAASAGADAVKFQSVTANELVSEKSFEQKIDGFGLNNVHTWGDFWKRVEIGADFQKEIADFCLEQKMQFISTPFDAHNADILDSLGVQLFKIASGDITHIPLIRHVASKKKAILLSTGAAEFEEIEQAVLAARASGVNEVALLHCVSLYPTPPELANLGRIAKLQKRFKCIVGFSDHTEGLHVALAAIALGARIIEKHFTIDRKLPGPDQKQSAEPDEFKKLVLWGHDVYLAKNYEPRMNQKERDMQAFMRRVIVAAKDLNAGHRIKMEDMKFKRIGQGLPPSKAESLISKTVKKIVKADQAINWEDLDV